MTNQQALEALGMAERLLREAAEELKAAHTIGYLSEWDNGEPEVKAVYEEHIAAADGLAALSAAAPAVAAARPAMPETWHVVAHIKGEPVLSIGYDWVSGRELASEEEHAIVGMAQHLLSFVGYGLPPSDFNPDDDAAHQAQPDAAAPAVAATREPSPTAGMNIAQRILHVGGRNNDAGYVEFGSIQAVEALVRQVLRDIPTPAAVSAPSDVVKDAARYRWLREQGMLTEGSRHPQSWRCVALLADMGGEHADAAIDAAMLAAAPQVPAQEGGAA